MKQINFKIEKNATEVKTYIEFENVIEFLKEQNKINLDFYLEWNDAIKNIDDEDEIEEAKKFAEAYLERSCEIDVLINKLTKQFIEFTNKVNENGFS